MSFKHVPPFPLPTLSDEIVPGTGRIYTTPDGTRYPSVTTVIGAGTDHSYLDKWRKRVGIEEAQKITTQATRRGSAVHELAERYLLNDPDYAKGHMPFNVAPFKTSIKPILDEHIGLIAGLELPLYSDTMKVAGRVDCIAKWDGVWAIIDFKTSRRVKKETDILNYFMQESCYSRMFYERVGLEIPLIVTVMAVDHDEPLVFVKNAADYIEKFIEVRAKVPF